LLEDQRPVAFVKFRLEPGAYHLCYAFTDSRHRDQGHAGAVIDKFLSSAVATHPDFEVVAEIKSENPEVIEHLLKSRGFRKAGLQWSMKLKERAGPGAV